MVVFTNINKVLYFLSLIATTGLADPPAPLRTHNPEMKKPQVTAPTKTLIDNAVPAAPPKTNTNRIKTSKLPSTAQSGGSCKTQHSVDAYVQMTSSSTPQADPIGGVYFLSDFREKPQVFHLSQPNSWPSQITFVPDGVAQFALSPTGNQMLFTSHKDGNEQYQLHWIHLSSKNVGPLTGDGTFRIESFRWGPSEDWIVFTSNKRNKVDFDLYRLDLSTRKETLLVQLSGLNFVTDVSQNGALIAITQYRSIVDSDILVFDQIKGKLTTLSDSWTNSGHKKALFSGDSKNILFLSELQTEKAQIYHLNLDSPSKPTLITRENHEIEDFVVSPNRKRLTYVMNEEGYSKFSGSELQTNGMFHKPVPMPKFPSGVVSNPSYLRSGNDPNALFFNFTSSTTQLGVWKWSQGKRVPWTQPNLGLIDPQCFASETLIKYKSFDGLEIPAFLYLPREQGNEKKPIPFVIYSHGGPEAQFRPTFSKIFQYFLQRGFGILAPNIRGSSGYGKIYVSLDDYKKRMDSVQDTLEGARWLITQGYTLPDRLGIFGGSYGGFVVLRSIQEGSNLFGAAAESVGIADFITFLKNTSPYRRSLREVEYGPLTDEHFLKSISPMTYLSQIKTPLLIFHGANDPRVPVSESETLAKSLRERNIPVELKVFTDEGHGNTKLSNILEQARLMVHFFESQFAEKLKRDSRN